MHIRRLGFHGDAEGIFRRVVGERTPRGGVLRENNRPLVGIRDHMQPVGSLVERLAFNQNGIAERDRGVFIRARAPYLAVRNQGTPNLAVVHERPVIVDGDVGDPDPL